MSLGVTALLRRAGAGSPLIAPVVYVAGLLAGNTAVAVWSESVLAALFMLAAWVLTGLFLFVVVTWFRDDDWLAAGFLIGITVVLGTIAADIVAESVASGSFAAAVLSAPGAIFGVVLRSIFFVPLCGGVVALARWITNRVRRRTPT